MVLLFPSLASGETVKWGDIVERGGVHYKKFTDVPFTGKTTGEFQGKLKNGKKEGPWVRYYKNGRKEGLGVGLYPDGTLIEQWTGTYKDGKKVK